MYYEGTEAMSMIFFQGNNKDEPSSDNAEVSVMIWFCFVSMLAKRRLINI